MPDAQTPSTPLARPLHGADPAITAAAGSAAGTGGGSGGGSGQGGGQGGGSGGGKGIGLPRGWRWLLFGSLALNLLVVGMVAGTLIRGGPPGPHRGTPPGMAQRGPGSELSMLWRALPRSDIEALRREAPMGRGDSRRPGRDEMEANLAARETEMRARIDEMTALLRADPFDPAPLAALLGERLAQQSARSAEALEAMLGRITALAPQERNAMADRLGERRGGRD